MRWKRASHNYTVTFGKLEQPRSHRTLQICGHAHLRLLTTIKLGLPFPA